MTKCLFIILIVTIVMMNFVAVIETADTTNCNQQILDLPVPKNLLTIAKKQLKEMAHAIQQCQRAQGIPIIANRRTQRRGRGSQQQSGSKGRRCNRRELYAAINSVDDILTKIQKNLESQGVSNLIQGNNNRVMGKENIVIGDHNSLKGDDNWIISKDNYNGSGNNFLVYLHWAIDMSKKAAILANPWTVIKRIDMDNITKIEHPHQVCHQLRKVFHYREEERD